MDRYEAMLSPAGLFVLGIFACYIWALTSPIREAWRDRKRTYTDMDWYADYMKRISKHVGSDKKKKGE